MRTSRPLKIWSCGETLTRKRDYHKIFKLKRGVKIHWINERTFDVQELSGFAWPIIYQITTADDYYLNEQGRRVYFTPELSGLSTQRKVSDVVMRLGVFLCIIVGLGARQASWLMQVLFQVMVSKSAIDRWVDEVGDSLSCKTSGEAEAQAKLTELKHYAAHHEKDGYTKSIAFLEENFKNMTMFLRAPGVQRNSLAKTGIRVLRRSAKSDRFYRLDKRRLRA